MYSVDAHRLPPDSDFGCTELLGRYRCTVNGLLYYLLREFLRATNGKASGYQLRLIALRCDNRARCGPFY
jgi:hypothetical protein